MVEPMNISGFQPPALPFPAKVKSERRAAPARTLPIKVNGYALDLSHAVPFVEKFELGIHLKLERGDVKDATKGPRLDVALAARRRALYSIMIALYKKHPEIFGNDRHQFAYDCGRILYAMNLRAKLPEDGRGQFVVPKSEWSDHTTKFFPAAAIEMIITVQFTEEINIGEFVKHKVIKDITDENYRPIQQFLEVLTNQALIDHGDHLIFKNRIYEKGSEYDAPLVEGKVAKMGMEKNIRPIGDSPSTTSMMLQLDAKKSPFFKGQDVLKFLMEYLGCSERDLESRAHKEIRKLTAQLKDVCVETTHLEKPRQFCISRISEKGAEDTYFDLKDGGNISVYKYYQTQYQIRLHYPGLPVAEERKAGKNGVNISYHPLECLNIVKGQRVDLKKQTPKLTEGLIRQCQMLPRNLEVHVEEERKYARLTSRSKNKELDAFGVRIVDGMTVVDGKQLFGPSIRYENVSVDPRPDGIIDWKTGNREKYTKAARVNSVAVLVFDKCLDQRQAQQFIDSFFRTLESRGLRMCSTRDVEFETPYAERTEEVHNAVATYAKKKYTIVLGLTRDKLDPVHNTLKLAEQRYGIPTMHIWTQTAQKAISPQGGMQVLSNLAMKFNEKVGGVNYSLEVSQAYARNYMAAYRTDPKSLNNSYFGARNMFVGIDVAHAPPQSFADRIEGVPPSEPTVVGFAHTVGDVMASRGWYWMQKPRLTSITSIDQNFVKALTIFKRETGSLPTSIIVYRGGVSEGEFRSVQEEALQVQGTLREFGSLNGVSNYQPYVCWLVVQTKSNYRLLPAQEMRGNRPADLNVQPGACVDTSAVHPLYNEFVLVPHKAIQGTARPIRVTEVYNEGGPKWNLDDIENVTHSLCFGLGIVCGSVSMPSPLFHATNLSKRGRNVWKEAVMDESEGTTVSSFGNAVAGRFRNDGSPDFFEKLSEVFVHHIEDKLYWA